MSTLMRRWLKKLNLAATLLLVGVLFILVNFVASRRYVRVDVTKTKISALSEKTVKVLTGLTEPAGIVVFYQPVTAERRPDPLYPLITALLKEYEQYSKALTIQYVEPYRDQARAEQLAKQFDIDRVNLVIVHAGTRHKYLSDTDLAEYDYQTMALGAPPRVSAFKGEEAITSALLSVTEKTQPLVWVVTGHGEKAIDDPQPKGLTELKKHLERENIKVEEATLLDKPEIPQEVKAILLAGPTRPLAEAELLVLQAYLERGGRLLALLDPLHNTGLDGFLARWGIELGHDIVVDPARRLPMVSPANLFVTTYTQHPVVEHMETFLTLFPLARSVQPAQQPPEGVEVTRLAMTSPDGWGETNTASETFQYDRDQDTQGPVAIAVAAERKAPQLVRIVVVGDADFVANGQLGNIGNLDLALGAMHWLVEQERLIGIGPKVLEAIKLSLTARQMTALFWFSIAGLPLFVGLSGGLMWWLRRQ